MNVVQNFMETKNKFWKKVTKFRKEEDQSLTA